MVRGLLIVVRGLLIVVVSLIAEHGFQGLWCMGLVALWRVESSRTRDRTRVTCTGRWILNHWTTREVFLSFSFLLPFKGWIIHLCMDRPHFVYPGNYFLRVILGSGYRHFRDKYLSLKLYLYFLHFLAVLGFCCSAWASHCGGFSRCGARALGTWWAQ